MSNIKQIFKAGVMLSSSAVTYNTCIVEASLNPREEVAYGTELYNAFWTIENEEMKNEFRRYCNEREENVGLLTEWLLGEGAPYREGLDTQVAIMGSAEKTADELFGREDLEMQAAIMESGGATADKSHREGALGFDSGNGNHSGPVETESERSKRHFDWLCMEKGFDLRKIQTETEVVGKAAKRWSKNSNEQDEAILSKTALDYLEWVLNAQWTFGVARSNFLTLEEKRNGKTAVLANIGATCYLNSAFQLLVRVPPFRQAIEEYNGNDILIWPLKFLFRSMQELRFLKSDYMNEFVSILQRFMPKNLNLRLQHDVSELLAILFDRIEKSFPQGHSPTSCITFYMEKTFFSDDGSVRSRQRTSANMLTLPMLTLPFPGKKVYPLKILIKYCFALSEISDNGTSVQQQESVKEWPNWLIVHLGRFKYEKGESSKINNSVEVPKKLDLSAHGGPKECTLIGTIHHAGGLENGHYVGEFLEREGEVVYNDEKRGEDLSKGMTPYLLLFCLGK
jgi:hypothetical protein